MAKPRRRDALPRRHSDNEKRKLADQDRIDPAKVAALRSVITYHGHPKHKASPHAYGLSEYRGDSGDRTLCDAHAGFHRSDMASIRSLLERGLSAGLVGHVWEGLGPGRFWTVSDAGWVFEAKKTNPEQADYHGYPVRPSEAIAELVYRRFATWATDHTDAVVRQAADNCRLRYGFKR